MASQLPRFWSQPGRYLRWAAIEKPAIFYSLVIGSLGPIAMVVVPPVRRMLGDGPREVIPMTYPIPTTPRKTEGLDAYDD